MYLVIETETNDNHKYMHFIDLEKQMIKQEMKSFLNHLKYFPGQKITKCSYRRERLTNW